MTLLIRFFLISTIIYLLIRSFARYFEEKQDPPLRNSEPTGKNGKKTKGVPKGIGEYVDYEDIDK